MNASNRHPSTSSLVGPLLMVLFGGISLVVGLKSGAESWAFTSRAIRIQGTVLQHDNNIPDEGTSYKNCRAVVSYRIGDKSYEVFGPVRAQPISTGWPKVSAIGSTVTVLYGPDRPEEALVESFEEQLGEGVLFGGLGLTFLLVGIVLLWRRRYRQVCEGGRA
ncbi:MAG: DUF3592 domain-containing protein [Planctomycetota bacterium]|nr:DUF3592 domain-containing protein [Planctomycetota bacterium]